MHRTYKQPVLFHIRLDLLVPFTIFLYELVFWSGYVPITLLIRNQRNLFLSVSKKIRRQQKHADDYVKHFPHTIVPQPSRHQTRPLPQIRLTANLSSVTVILNKILLPSWSLNMNLKWLKLSNASGCTRPSFLWLYMWLLEI